MELKLAGMSNRAKKIWHDRYPCGEEGGWINFRILSDDDLDDVLEFIKIKIKPLA